MWFNMQTVTLEGILVHLLYNGNSLTVQWLEFVAFTAEGLGWIPGLGTKTPQSAWHDQIKEIIDFHIVN